MSDVTVLTDRFDRALLYATHVHGGQRRKGTSIPYVAHFLAVAATVSEYGGERSHHRSAAARQRRMQIGLLLTNKGAGTPTDAIKLTVRAQPSAGPNLRRPQQGLCRITLDRERLQRDRTLRTTNE